MQPPVLPPTEPYRLAPPSPPNKIAMAVLGACVLLFGVLHEILGRPLVPITMMIGFLALSIGFGVATAILSDKFKVPGRIAYYVLAIAIVFYEMTHDTSALPLASYIGCYYLARAGLILQKELD